MLEKDTVTLSAVWSRRHRGACLDVAKHDVSSAVETTSAVVKLVIELSLTWAEAPRSVSHVANVVCADA